MSLSPSEEALVRDLIAQNAALLSLASSESTIISKLGATKTTLSALTAASSLADSDLMLVRQGVTDKSATGAVVKTFVTAEVMNATQKPGEICFFARSTAPSGFLKANGAAVSRTTYAALFAAIGTVSGVGDGSTTFNLPDLRGEFVRGWNDDGSIDSGRGLGTAQAHQSNNLRDVELGLNSDVSWSGTLQEDGSYSDWTYAGDEGAGPNYQHRFRLWGRETRPRNVAFLACIKY